MLNNTDLEKKINSELNTKVSSSKIVHETLNVSIEKDDLKEVPKEKPSNKEKDIVFFRSDYVQCATVRICKHNKTIQEETLFDKVQIGRAHI